MTNIEENIVFYKESLREADNEIRIQHETGKALKDIVGLAFEKHRKRVWNYFGFDVSKERHEAMFDVDWSITYKGELIAFEEDKGHYVDSCFMERALTGFCKTVNTYQKKGKTIPVLILHSFTRYKKFSEKFEEDMDTRKTEIRDEIQKKLVYTTLVECDRLSKKRWFSKELYDCYSVNASEELVIKDIEFIQSLVPVSE
jgi:hypothetical protein